jgi:NADP-dependent 3-hydroxy acid dehydrogenase YdfG
LYQTDLAELEQVRSLAERVQTDFDGLHILVHSAGVFAMSGIATANIGDFDRQYYCNVRAPFALTKLLLPCLVAHQGQVVFINSTAGLQAAAGISQYAATKHALRALADSLREEANTQGVRVLSVFLGRTATPMQAAIHELEGKPYDPAELIQPSQVAAIVAEVLALERDAEVTDIRIRPMRKPTQPSKTGAKGRV